jgi:hypothetical protein
MPEMRACKSPVRGSNHTCWAVTGSASKATFIKQNYKLIQGFAQLLAEAGLESSHRPVHPVEDADFLVILKNMNVPPVVVRARELENVASYFSAHDLSFASDEAEKGVKRRIKIEFE